MRMARETREQVTARMRRHWERAGSPSRRQMMRDFQRLYDVEISNVAIGNYLNCTDDVPEPETMNIDLIVCWAAYFDVPVGSISRTVAARIAEELLHLAHRERFLAQYAAGDSNPEPADSVPGQLELIAAA